MSDKVCYSVRNYANGDLIIEIKNKDFTNLEKINSADEGKGLKLALIGLEVEENFVKEIFILNESSKVSELKTETKRLFPKKCIEIVEVNYLEELNTNGSHCLITTSITLLNTETRQTQVVNLLSHEIRISTEFKNALVPIKDFHKSLHNCFSF